MVDGSLDIIFAVLFIIVLAVASMMLLKSFDSKSLLDNYKFEIKKSKDMHQRLSDVKGVDEIKEEIENLIKMIKDPNKYLEKGAKLHKGVLLSG